MIILRFSYKHVHVLFGETKLWPTLLLAAAAEYAPTATSAGTAE
jgi:hypothetical protein